MRAALLLALCACQSVPSSSGQDALMQVAGAQFFYGAMPAREDGPAVGTVQNDRTVVAPGEVGHPLSGALDPHASAVALGLSGDVGYWVLPAEPPDFSSPDQLSFKATLSFSPELPPGSYEIVARAVDAQGRFGPANAVTLKTQAAPDATGALVVSLRWDTEADLDLHVVDAAGVEIWARHASSYEPPPFGTAPDPDAQARAGRLDFDSNAACVIDGHRSENVVWTLPPPRGLYTVRVDTFSLCGEAGARWTVAVRRGDQITDVARGLSLDFDTRASHERGAGAFALQFEVK
jgi:hypothetical protein